MASYTKVALITGAGTGIGRVAALALQRTGYHVVLAGRRAELLEETAKIGDSSGPGMLPVPTDVADPDQVRALFAKTKEVFGRLGVLSASLPLDANVLLMTIMATKMPFVGRG